MTSATAIHPTAIIYDGAKIADTVEIAPYAVIGPNVTIGAGTKVGAHAVIDGHTTIGEDCRIFASSSIGLEPQDLSYKGEPTGVIMGDRTTVREFVTIHRGTADRFTRVGSDCFFMNYSHVAHDCQLGNGVIFANSATLAGHVVVGDRVVIAGTVVVHQFVRIGRLAMCSGVTGTRRDIPPFSMCDGRPLAVTGLNLVGLRRAQVGPDARAALKQAYKTIYRLGLNTTQALERIEAEGNLTEEVKEVLAFYRASKRGVVKGAFAADGGIASVEED